MSLAGRLPPSDPNAGRLRAFEQSLQLTHDGQRVTENFERSLSMSFLDGTLFERFCSRLGQLLPDRPDSCDRGRFDDAIDDPDPFYCRGPHSRAGSW